MTLGPTSSRGGAAVAQPQRVAAWQHLACLAGFAIVTVALAGWAAREVRQASGGSLGAPLDDSYIHFQFARGFARLRPLEYVAGLPRVPGATSLLWPALLAPAIWLGASGTGLITVTWLFGFASLFGQACEVFLCGRRFLSLPFAFGAGLLVLSFPANTWFAASAMEVVPLGFVLLRSARRAAEYLDGQRSTARANELLGLAFAGVLLRPEGALAALCVAVAFLRCGRSGRLRAAVAFGAPLSVPLINWLCTGSAAQTTTIAKWLPLNPYFHGQLSAAIAGNVRLLFGTLLNGEGWSWIFIPEGYWVLAVASLPALWVAAERRGARAHAACLCIVALGLLIPTSYETFLVNRLRYLWPFSGPWLLGLAALGQLLGALFAQLRPRLALLGLAVPALSALGFARLAPAALADLAQSAAAISAQQVSLGRWAAVHLPSDALIGVNDAGAISYYSERKTFDIVGLTTPGEARHWVAGAGSRFEHYEHLPRAGLPSHFLVYPQWFGLPSLLGPCLTERLVPGATILGGPLMVACQADFSSLGSGSKPSLDVGARRLLDELDVADLQSEASHAYDLGVASASDNLAAAYGGRVDGGRSSRKREQFQLQVEDGGLLILRLSAEHPCQVTISIGGRQAVQLRVAAGQFQELSLAVPRGVPGGLADISLHSQPSLSLFHYWSYGS